VSRAFVKEESTEPPLVVPRAPLPTGVSNYVTRRGLRLLHEERAALERSRPDPEAAGGASALAAHQARLGALDARIASAVTLDPASLPHDEVRFSALVALKDETGAERRYRIVGVDEADAQSGRIAFTAPLATALSGKHAGDTVTLRQSGHEREYEITHIDYTQDP
jgi:transcription elongation factor GreB